MLYDKTCVHCCEAIKKYEDGKKRGETILLYKYQLNGGYEKHYATNIKDTRHGKIIEVIQ